jgi:replicative DNA helicase
VKEHKVKCIIIDYLQLMNASGMTFGSREQEISTISRSLKGLAKELNIPIIALSQLNRNVESRSVKEGGIDAKRPQLSDLRESGAIEQDADIVAFIHRPEYYGFAEDEEGNSLIGVAEIIIAKHRNGALDNIQLSFKKNFAKFVEPETLSLSFNAPLTLPSKMNTDMGDVETEDDKLSFPTKNFGSGEAPF